METGDYLARGGGVGGAGGLSGGVAGREVAVAIAMPDVVAEPVDSRTPLGTPCATSVDGCTWFM